MENKINRLLILPVTGNDLNTQLMSILQQIKSFIEKGDCSVLQLSFFIDIKNNDEYLNRRDFILKTITNTLKFKPSTSVIAQSPANGYHISLELILLTEKSKKTTVLYKQEQDVAYTLILSPDTRELYAGGISSLNFDADFTDQVDESYLIMKSILHGEGFSFADIVRQWNYIEGILEIHECGDEHIQHYQVLNDIRSKYYAESEFLKGYPAATGIGMDAGGSLLEFYAVQTSSLDNILPIKNPKQVDAYHYSENVLVGDALVRHHKKTTPKFERAKYSLVNGIRSIYISGTASIQTEKTLGENDTRLQTEITLENISNLITPLNLHNAGVQNVPDKINYTFIRVYLKNRNDLKLVKAICDRYYVNIPIHYLVADICRDNLLLEIEGVAELG